MTEIPAAAEHVTPLGPVREKERLHSLDALRGMAILGIFFVNIQFFAMPFVEIMGLTLAEAPLSDRMAWSFTQVFCVYKFISMFSLLFGAGMAMQLMRARAAGHRFWPVYLRRLIVLGIFGAMHAMLLWYGDVLFIYAVYGLILLALSGLKTKALMIVAASLIAFSAVATVGFMAVQVLAMELGAGSPAAVTSQDVSEADEPAGTDVATPEAEPAEAETTDETGPPAEDGVVAAETGDVPADEQQDEEAAAEDDADEGPPLRGMDAIIAAQFQPMSPIWSEAETLAHREGPFIDVLAFRATTYAIVFVVSFFGYGWRVLGMFLLGAVLMQRGFFRPEKHAAQRRLMLWTLPLGLALEGASAWATLANEFQVNWMTLVPVALHEIGSFCLCLGYVGTVCWLMSTGRAMALFAPIRAVGRMALTNYLSTTIITTALMYWWGFGWFGTVSRPMQLVIVVCVYGALIIFTAGWMSFFRMGPFEWLWRSLTYLRPQPILREELKVEG